MLDRSLKLAASVLLLCSACEVSPEGPPDETRSAAGKVEADGGEVVDECYVDDDCDKGETCVPGYCPFWCGDNGTDCCVPNSCQASEGSGDACHSDADCQKDETCEPGYCPYWCDDDDPGCCVAAQCVQS